MQKSMLLVLFMGTVSGIAASDKLMQPVSSGKQNLGAQASCAASQSSNQLPTSYASRITSCVKTRLFGYVALAGVGLYGLYRLAVHLMYQEEERMFEEHQELETLTVSKKDFDMVNALIDAMEQDVMLFDEQPNQVKSLELAEFDDEQTANGCEGMRSAFCALYEQSFRHPESKAFLEEFVMIFRQAIDDAMVVA